jgi:ABC-2 type transport system ATP-binding protein
MSDTPALEIDELTVAYGATLAVDHLSLTITAGQTVALLGANGAGKSTTLNAVLGLIPATSGSVRVLGRRPLQAVRAGGVGGCCSRAVCPVSRESAR